MKQCNSKGLSGTDAPFLNINLTINDAIQKALHYWRKRHFKTASPKDLAYILGVLLLVAMDHPEEMTAWLNGMARYCEAEDLVQLKHLIGRVRARPEYRRMSLKAMATCPMSKQPMANESDQAVADCYNALFGNLEELCAADLVVDPRFVQLLRAAIEARQPLTRAAIDAAIPGVAWNY